MSFQDQEAELLRLLQKNFEDQEAELLRELQNTLLATQPATPALALAEEDAYLEHEIVKTERTHKAEEDGNGVLVKSSESEVLNGDDTPAFALATVDATSDSIETDIAEGTAEGTAKVKEGDPPEFVCENCGYTMFPAVGRKAKLFTDTFRCPTCNSPRDAFFDMLDLTDPRMLKERAARDALIAERQRQCEEEERAKKDAEDLQYMDGIELEEEDVHVVDADIIDPDAIGTNFFDGDEHVAENDITDAKVRDIEAINVITSNDEVDDVIAGKAKRMTNRGKVDTEAEEGIDMSERWAQLEGMDDIERMYAMYDSETGLPNPDYFHGYGF